MLRSDIHEETSPNGFSVFTGTCSIIIFPLCWSYLELLILTQANVTPAEAAHSSSSQVAFQACESRIIHSPSHAGERSEEMRL